MTDFGTDEFDVLTEFGWKSIKDVNINDKIWTMDFSSRKANLDTVKSIERYKFDNIIRISGKNIFGEFPINHNLLIENRRGDLEIVKLEDIFINRIKYSHSRIPKLLDISEKKCSYRKFIISAVDPKRVVNNGKEDPRLPLTMDKGLFCKILGLWLAEGSIGGTSRDGRFIPRQVVITQSISANPDKCDSIDKLWEEIPDNLFTYTRIYGRKKLWYLSDIRIANYFYSMGNVYTKKIPNDILSFEKDDLEKLLYWFALGDGRESNHRRKYDNIILDNYKDVFSVSKKLTEDLSYIALKCGVGISNYRKIIEKDYMFASHLIKHDKRQPLNFVSLNANSSISLKQDNLKIETAIKGREFIKFSLNSPIIYVRCKGKSYWTIFG